MSARTFGWAVAASAQFGLRFAMALDAITPSLKSQSVLLMAGRFAGFVVSFFIPIALVRLLDQTEFGAYKQFFLVTSFLISTLPMGFENSLFFFIPQDPRRAGNYLFQAAAVSLCSGVAAAAVLLVLRAEVGRLLNSPLVAEVMPFLCAFLVFELAGSLLERTLIIEKQARLAALLFAVSDGTRAVALIVPAALTGSFYWLTLGAAGYALLRLGAMLAWSAWQYRARFEVRLAPVQLKKQLEYALPIGGGSVVQTTIYRFHAFYVASAFSPALFAVYSVGSQQIAPIQIFSRSLIEVALVRMTEFYHDRRFDAMRALWSKLIAKQAIVVVPAVVGLWVLAYAFIEVLFTSDYLGAVPVFRISLLLMLLTIVNDHSVLRACARTKLIFVANVAALLSTVVLVPGLTYLFGLWGAALGFVAGVATMKLVGLTGVRKLLGTTVKNILPWGSLSRYSLASFVAAGLVYASLPLIPGALLQLLVGGVVFWALYFTVAWMGNLFTADDKREYAEIARAAGARLGLVRQ